MHHLRFLVEFCALWADTVHMALHLPEDIMARTNRTNRRPQRLKHRVEDRVARRALAREAEETYRHAPERTYVAGRLAVVTFTDPSWLA